MSVWEHAQITSVDEAQPPFKEWNGIEGWTIPKCPYCNQALKTLGKNVLTGISFTYPQLDVCQLCGWWIVSRRDDNNRGSEGEVKLFRAWGSLRKLDLSDISIPVRELQTYLLANYEDRFKVNPEKYEHFVAGVFSEFNYKVRVTSFSGDDGIDIFILDGDENDVVGIQVKRYKNKIEAEQIRSFATALQLNGVTKGIYVTTGEYRSGAISTAQRCANLGLAIELENAESFFDKMRIAQRPPYSSREDTTTPFYSLCQNPETIPYLSTHAW